MSLLITTGATVTFHSLLDQVLLPSFLEAIIPHYTSLTIQYGNEIQDGINISEKYITQLTTSLAFSQKTTINNTIASTYTYKGFPVVLFAFSKDINSWIKDADCVISHAGTGLMLDTLRLHKPLGVVANTLLMDNHQQQVATQFATLGYCLNANVDEVIDLAVNLKSAKFDLLPQSLTALEEIIYEELI